MPSKKDAQKKDEEESSSMLDMIKEMSAQLCGLTSKMDKIDSIDSEVKSL
jgi:hypothetical protein